MTFYDFGLNKKICKSCMLYVILSIMTYILITTDINGTFLYLYRYIKGI